MQISLAISLTSQLMRGGGGGVGPAYPQFPIGSKMRINSDSIWGRGRFGASPGDGLMRQVNSGSFEVAAMLSPRFNFEGWPKDNVAEAATYNGTTTWVDGGPGGMPGTGINYFEFLQPRNVTMDPDIMILPVTVNSRNIPNVLDRFTALWDSYITSFGYAVVGTMPPIVAGASFDDASYQANHLTINAGVRAYAAAKGVDKVLLLDFSTVMDPGLTGYCTNPAMLLADKVHVHPYGASILADYINSRLALITAPGPDLFDQRWNTLTNYHPNPTLTGTGGSRAGSWASGSVLPANYRGSNSTTTWSGVISTVEANPATGGQSLVLPIIPKSTSADTEIFTLVGSLVDTNGTVTNAALDGKYVVAGAEVEIVDASPYIGTPTLFLIGNGNAATTYSRSMDIDSANSNSPQRQGKAQTFKLMTDPVKIDAGITQCRIQLSMRSLGLSAWNAGTSLMTVKVKRVALWDVGAPKPRWNV